MTFEDETNAKLPAISCFIKLGDKYIEHINNNKKNKKKHAYVPHQYVS